MSHSSAQHAPELPHALYSANNYATTIRYSLYNAPWLPRRISDCGRQNRDPANPKPSRSTYAKSVFIRGIARLRRTRVSFTYVPQRLRPRFHSGSVTDRIVASKNSVSLTFHGPFAFAALDSCTNNGTNRYRSTVISPHFVRREDHFWSLK